MSKVKYNVLDRPKRAIHSQRLVITEEMAKLYGVDSTSESDEDFIPDDDKAKKANESAESNENHEENKDDDNDDDDDDDNSKTNDEEEENVAVEEKNVTNSKKQPIKKAKNEKKTEKDVKPKKKYKKKKHNVNQLKAEEYINENKRILEKFTSKSSSNQQNQQKSSNIGPYVKVNRVLDKELNLNTFIVCNNLRSNDDELNNDSSLIKIPKDKIEMQLKNLNGTWLCKLCHNRPLHHNLGDLYGPYMFKSENSTDDVEDIWVHEACAVWSPNIYVLNNKLCGLSNVIENSLKTICSNCKKSGATLMCTKHACKQIYHYYCAIKSDCKFNEENFTILCKNHTV